MASTEFPPIDASYFDPNSPNYDPTAIYGDPSVLPASTETGVSASTPSSAGGTDWTSLIGGLGNLGITIAGAATGRPVVRTQAGTYSLGQKPIVTGQINITTVAFLLAGVVVVVLVLRKG